jgi:hypothetical protein
VLGVGLGEDRADGGGDHLGVALRHAREDVAHKVHPAPLRPSAATPVTMTTAWETTRRLTRAVQ